MSFPCLKLSNGPSVNRIKFKLLIMAYYLALSSLTHFLVFSFCPYWLLFRSLLLCLLFKKLFPTPHLKVSLPLITFKSLTLFFSYHLSLSDITFLCFPDYFTFLIHQIPENNGNKEKNPRSGGGQGY